MVYLQASACYVCVSVTDQLSTVPLFLAPGSFPPPEQEAAARRRGCEPRSSTGGFLCRSRWSPAGASKRGSPKRDQQSSAGAPQLRSRFPFFTQTPSSGSLKHIQHHLPKYLRPPPQHVLTPAYQTHPVLVSTAALARPFPFFLL